MLIKWGVINENVDNSPLVYMPSPRACAPNGSAKGDLILIVRAHHSALFPFAPKYSII